MTKLAKAEKLIVKYLTNTISAAEMDTLTLWLDKAENTEVLRDNIEISYAIDYNMSDYDTEKTKNFVLRKIQRDKRKGYRLKFKNSHKYAAVALLFLFIGYFYHKNFNADELPKENIIQKEGFITLELDDGTLKIIAEDGSTLVKDKNGTLVGSQKGTRIAYDTNAPVDKLIYNTLTVPYGKKFEIALSDGTMAFLNSGSSLRYPVQFLNEGDRKVFLSGEAFLEVTENVERPFIVNTGELNIRVLGTKFNVSTYPEDVFTEVVLVDGAVGLYEQSENYDADKSTFLSPGLKGSYNKAENSISTKPVITSVYTSWIDGELVFRNSTFENILKKMERHYNVTIINKNKGLANEQFNASFAKEPIKRILDYFEVTYGIEYSINDKIITIR